MRSDEPVDAVLLWVDGNDPVLNAKRREWAPEGALSLDDQAGKTRYADCGEIHYCIRSIRKFAPWIRRIYVVTDGQDPQVEPGAIPVEVVDHSAIFAGYESFLPVFNSIAIETMYWRIPGLSRRFVYFNDDFFLARPVEPSDFFTEDGVIAYARPFSVPYEALLRRLRYDPEHTHFSFRGVMLNTARLMGEKRRFFRYNHTPRGLLRDYYEEAFAARKESTFPRPRPAPWRSVRSGRTCISGSAGKGRAYFRRKFDALRRFSGKFIALNSLDKLQAEERAEVFAFLDGILSPCR